MGLLSSSRTTPRARRAGGRVPGLLRAYLVVASGALLFVGTGARGAFAVQVSGANRAQVSLSAASLTFASHPVGSTSVAQRVTLSSSGDAPLAVNSISVSGGDFRQTNACPSTLPPDRSCAISVYFSPKGAGTRTGTLRIATNAPGGPRLVSLSGRGGDFMVSASPGSAVVVAGQVTAFRLSITPTSGFDRSVSLRCSGAPAGIGCAVSPSVVKLNGSSASTVAVNVRTTARSPKGNFRLGLAARHGTLSHGTNVSLTVK